jgi:hypothetical protein
MYSDSYLENNVYNFPRCKLISPLLRSGSSQHRGKIDSCLSKALRLVNPQRIKCFTTSTPKARSQQPHPSRKNNHIQTPSQSNKRCVDTNPHRCNLPIHLGCLGFVLLRAMSRGLCIRRGFGWGLLGRSRGWRGSGERGGRKGKTGRRTRDLLGWFVWGSLESLCLWCGMWLGACLRKFCSDVGFVKIWKSLNLVGGCS